MAFHTVPPPCDATPPPATDISPSRTEWSIVANSPSEIRRAYNAGIITTEFHSHAETEQFHSHAETDTFAISTTVLALLSSAIDCAAQEASPTADENRARKIVEDADQIRFPQEGFQVDVTISTSGTDATSEERKYRVLSKGNENTVVMVTEPASERGQIMLMKGRDLWVFLPNVSQPVRLSLAQRLPGRLRTVILRAPISPVIMYRGFSGRKQSTEKHTSCWSWLRWIAALRTSA